MIAKKMLVRARKVFTNTLCPLIGAGIFLAVFSAAEAHATVFM